MDLLGLRGLNWAAYAAAALTAAEFKRSFLSLSYAALLCIVVECRMHRAAALRVLSPCRPFLSHVTKMFRKSFGVTATPECRLNAAFTMTVHRGGDRGALCPLCEDEKTYGFCPPARSMPAS